MASNNKCQVYLDPNGIRVVFQNPAVPNATSETIARVNVIDFVGIFNQKPVSAQEGEWTYPYAAQSQIIVKTKQGIPLILELQNITNQATWSTGTLAGVNNALVALNAWL